MTFEIDQSGKLEHLNTITVVAGSNKYSNAIKITASEKRKLIQQLRKSLIPHKDLLPILFGILVFILIRDLKEIPSVILIDEEYTGKDEIIKETIQKLLEGEKLREHVIIRFGRIGKLSPAHKLAWSIHRGKLRKSVKSISNKQVLKFWK